MKSIIALLLGLSAFVSFAEDTADTDGEAFSWDSSDANSERSYDGVVIQVYKANGEAPLVTLGTDLDNHETTYCLNFVRTFEAVGYDTTATTSDSTTVNEVTGSEVDLSTANCTVSDITSSSFTISCNDINDGELSLGFNFVESDGSASGNDGLEFSITLEGYTWVSTDDSAQFVLVQSLEDCSSEYAYSADSEDGGDEEDEEDEEDETDEPTTTADNARRLLEDDTEEDDETDDGDSDSADEEDGISSDDSNEYDAGFAQFVLTGEAQDQCDGVDPVTISADLVDYNGDEEELHIVFGHFDCTLYIDPEYTVDASKFNSGAGSISMFIAGVIGFVAWLF